MLDIYARKRVSRAVDPIARLARRVGLSPSAITVLGFLITLTGAVLIGAGELAWGCGIVGFGAALDVLDGVLARMTGSESARGALLDTFTDRLGEVAMWTGLMYYLSSESEALLTVIASSGMAASLLIPFLRAKAEGADVTGKGGLMGRAERIIVFCLGVGLEGFGLPTLEWGVWILTGLVWLTAAQRFVRTWRQIV
ncbi:MAG: CDP-alcohol phosphatidyltransferase family protein [Acidimicrobiia bacterium]|nr:CDP-alcohol phosphatidyltransferase family protein [Acidimicrobiia bacterium]